MKRLLQRFGPLVEVGGAAFLMWMGVLPLSGVILCVLYAAIGIAYYGQKWRWSRWNNGNEEQALAFQGGLRHLHSFLRFALLGAPTLVLLACFALESSPEAASTYTTATLVRCRPQVDGRSIVHVSGGQWSGTVGPNVYLTRPDRGAAELVPLGDIVHLALQPFVAVVLNGGWIIVFLAFVGGLVAVPLELVGERTYQFTVRADE